MFRAHITAATMKKRSIWRFFIVTELREYMRLGLDQSHQHFDRCKLKLENGDLQRAVLPERIHISPEYLYEIQDDSGIAIRQSIWYIVEMIFPDINGNFHAPEQQWIFG